MTQDNTIYLIPVSLREANDYLTEYIRQYRPMHSCKFSVGCAMGGKLVGAAIVGRCWDDSQALQVDRIYATGGRTAYGMLCGAVAWAAQALGYWRIIAFLQADRPDSALRAVGWTRAGPVDTGRKRASKTLRYERLLMVRRRWRG